MTQIRVKEYGVNQLNLCGKTAVEKNAWVKPYHSSKVKLPYDGV